MEWLQNWIRNLILVILLAHFIELLLPDNELRKYVKVVIGFFVIIVILTPLLQVTNRQLPGLDFNLVATRTPSFAEIVDRGKQLRENQQEKVEQDYQRKLAQQIKAVIKLNSNLTNLQVEVKLARKAEKEKIKIEGEKLTTDNSSRQNKSPKQLAEKLQNLVVTLYGFNPEQVQVKIR